jgi:ABC-2 type transport system permease protein
VKTARFFFSLLRMSIRASISQRGTFLLECVLMIGNNLVFFSIWWIFFRQFNDIRGWQIGDMVTLMTVGMGAYGLMQICFGGVKTLSRVIVSGNLDPFMTQPKNILLHLTSSRSLSKGWGQLMTMVILIALGKLTAPLTLALILLSIVCGCLVFTAMGIMAHSLAFWLGSIERISKQYFDSLYLFTVYPTNIYSGFLKLIMFTLIPAGVIGYLPVEMIRSFSWEHLLLLVGSTLAIFACSFFVFYCGLKRYESGNQFGMRL